MLIVFKERVSLVVPSNDLLPPHHSKLNMICNCSHPCHNTSLTALNSNELAFDSSYLDVMETFCGYKVTPVQQPDPNLNYSAIVIRNLCNHLKVLTLVDESIANDESQEWATCNESTTQSQLLANYTKLYLNLKPVKQQPSTQQQYASKAYDNFLHYLDELDPKVVLVQLATMVGCFDSEFAVKPQLLLDRINELMFDGQVNGLVARWAHCGDAGCVAEMDMERTCRGKLHMVLKLNKKKKANSIEVIQVMIIEMAIFFLNKNFENELTRSGMYKVFDKLQNYTNIILMKLSNLSQLNLMKSYGIDRILVYTFDLQVDQLDPNCAQLLSLLNSAHSSFRVDLFYFLPYVHALHHNNLDNSNSFEIEPRNQPNNHSIHTTIIPPNPSKPLTHFVRTLLKQVQMDCDNQLQMDDNDDEDSDDYVHLWSECHTDAPSRDGHIITSDITRIQVPANHTHLLHTPNHTRHSLDRRVKTRNTQQHSVEHKNKKKKKKDSLPNDTNNNLCTWAIWIDNLQANTPDESNDSSSSLGTEDTGNLPSMECVSLLTLINLLLNNRALNPASVRNELCAHLKHTEAFVLERKVTELFKWMNEHLFFSLLNDVQVEWSYRLKSTAACTIVEKEPSPAHIIIRLSWNLLTRLQIIEIAKMLLHEMVHAFLGLAIADFCERHDSNFVSILKKLNHILKLNIPIEHDYEETMELAYIWKCSKCLEKRVRFYDVAPTILQKEKHALKCDGNLVRIVTPRIFKR